MKEEEVNKTDERLEDEEGENFVAMKKPNAEKEAYKVAIGEWVHLQLNIATYSTVFTYLTSFRFVSFRTLLG